MRGNREKFLKIYSDLPLNIRREVILIINNDPITWNVAYLEIKNDTDIGKIILKKLNDLGII